MVSRDRRRDAFVSTTDKRSIGKAWEDVALDVGTRNYVKLTKDQVRDKHKALRSYFCAEVEKDKETGNKKRGPRLPYWDELVAHFGVREGEGHKLFGDGGCGVAALDTEADDREHESGQTWRGRISGRD
ncbi:hypothetical protein HK101_011642 [Irineochytrium annulatum]|nr:hypothetical protein HK101_011642 [Irineochytrium annulatum]